MPAIVINSHIFGEMFGTDEMRVLFSDHALMQRYLDVEAALARDQATLGVIPTDAADAISAVASVDRVDFDTLSKRTQRIGNPNGILAQPIGNTTPKTPLGPTRSRR